MFMSNCWQVAAYSAEVGGKLLSRTIAGQPVILYRAESGDAVAMQDRCPHRYLPLSLGRLDGEVVECGYHGLRFGPSGVCLRVPGQEIIPAKARVTVYPTVERYKFVWVWLGDAEKAAPALVPDFHWMVDEEWAVAEGYHHIEAGYRFLVDNLLDLSHETFVHPESIGNDAVADSPANVSVVGDKTVRVHRDMLNCEPPPQIVALIGSTGKIDRWHTTYYTPPGFCVIENGAVPAGTKDLSRGFEGRILNLITPETEKSSHYFWAHARNRRLDDAELTGVVRQRIRKIFDQDKAVLEAQQIQSDLVGSTDPGIVLGIDAGPIQGRRMLAAALRDDHPTPEIMRTA
jgi:phenylpropionate dioxygenase-like ring-hydroxylating dioxygenase large terminal subunit